MRVIINAIDKKVYNKFVRAQKHSQFLQSWEWGEFQKSQGLKIFRINFCDQDFNFHYTLVRKKIPIFRKFYFYAPRIGIRDLDAPQLEFLFSEIAQLASRENVSFLRFEARSKFLDLVKFFRKKLEFKKTIDIQARQTLILNLEKDTEKLMSEMHQKTRYNIRLSRRKGVKIIEANLDRFDEFWELMRETSKRDKFRLHSRDYYFNLCKFFLSQSSDQEKTDLSFKLYLAEYKDRVIAASLVSFFGNMATYVHGASSSEFRNLMAPHFIQWQAICDAKDKGLAYYDFCGIDSERWPGVTRFKKGFGGEEISYPGTYDLVFDQKFYTAYRFFRKLRRLF